MTDNKNFNSVISAAEETLKKFGFEPITEENEEDNICRVKYAGENGVIKIEYSDEKLIAYSGTDAENPDDTPKRIMLSLLTENASPKEIDYVAGELKNTITDKYSVKKAALKKPGGKGPQTVSKAAVKNGSFYDPNTLASRLCLVFPEIRDAYKNNISTYGDFLAEEFFMQYGTPKVIEAIKQNNPATMKKMFQILNEIYEDGTNDTQSLIAVSILGQLENDQVLLARCVDYMSDTMAPPVIEVNKYLATRSGKKAQAKLADPPVYKPKKKKKKGFMQRAMEAGSLQNQ